MARIGFVRSKYRKHRVGAAWVKGNTIVIGSNSQKTHPTSKMYNTHWEWEHAEMAVIRAIQDFDGGHLFIYREKADGSLAIAQPCSACIQLIKAMNIKRITYTIIDGFFSKRV